MTRTLSLTLATFFATLAAATSGQAKDLAIECPAVLEVKSSLTRGPWTGPDSRTRLQATNVRRDQAKTVLICEYGKSGSAEIKAPTDYPSCVPSKGGFVCSDGRKTRAGPRVDTVVELRSNDRINLDNGRLNANRGEDLLFTGQNGPYVAVKSVNGAKLSRPLNAFKSIRDCQRRNYKSRELLPGRDIWNGSVVCYRTNRGRTGVLVVQEQNRSRLRLSIRTWEQPVSAQDSSKQPAINSARVNYGRGGVPARSSLEFQFPGTAIIAAERRNDGVRFVARGGRTEHYSSLADLKAPAGPSVLTFDVRPETARKLRVQFFDSSPNGMLVDFDLANNTNQLSPHNILLNPNVSIQTVGGNWRRITMSGLFPARDRRIIVQLLDVNGGSSFAPSGQSVLIRHVTLK